jgi:hypothetical protein
MCEPNFEATQTSLTNNPEFLSDVKLKPAKPLGQTGYKLWKCDPVV